ncbi:MAG: hypothetical protein KDK08_03495 [Rhizobiaceae bacterium]|nr:hypothetical protein [Rhizobiaceae bacterium]
MAVQPYDEAEINDEDTIIRRVPAQHIVWDENGGQRRRRISSALYAKSTGPQDGMSVDIEALMLKDGVDPADYITSDEFPGAVSFSAAEVRALDLTVGYDPIKNDPVVPDNPYHGEVWRKTEARRFTGAQQNGLRDAAKWYVEVEGVELK